MAGKIKAFVIFEMLGRPLEHLKKTLSDFVDKLGQEGGIEIKSRKINEPKKIEDTKQEIYTTFAELEIELRDMPSIFKVIFVYMPSHIEIIEPEEMKIKNFDLNIMVNELARKLHQYDEIAKRLAIERSILHQQLQQAGIQPATQALQQQAQQMQQNQQKLQEKDNKKKIKKRKKKK